MAGNIVVTGTILCPRKDLDMTVASVREHVRLTRQEPGCILFSIQQSADDPCIFVVSERFVDCAAFRAHTARTRASAWWAKTRHMARELVISTC